ncbi:MAG: endonuclease/exonuclease/phosphatase family protein [Sphingobacteriales bacterium]|nr:endonuclease/exonuclease/phosphatase family protein [Sphingobacteriales bacterium]
MRRLTLLDKLFFYLNIPVAILLGISQAALYVNPSGKFWWVAVAGLAYPYLFFANLIFIIFWLLKFRLLPLLLSLGVMIGGRQNFQYTFATATTQLSEKDGAQKAETENSASLKVMTYNVENFDLYNWTENSTSRDSMLQLIRHENPDIIFFQEFFTDEDEKGNFNNVKKITNDLGYPYHRFEKTLTLENTKHWGLATFSKYPIISGDSFKKQFPKSLNLITYCVVEVAKGLRFQLFNSHLQSYRLGQKDYKYLEKISKIENIDLKGSKSILIKLRDAFRLRSAQVHTLAENIESSPYPVIVCGDFNDTPNSFAYHTLRQKKLKDAFLECGAGMGGTYNGPLPSFRIDYILHDKSFETKSFKIIEKGKSDHFPVVAVLHYDSKKQ